MKMTSQELELQLARVRMLESNVTFQFSMISKLMDINALQLLEDTPLTLLSYRLLKTVETFEEMSIADLGRHMVTDNAQISRAATDLHKKGLVVFAGDPTNKRRKLVRLSPDGIALMDRIAPRFAARRKGVEDCLGPEVIEQLHAVFPKLVAHFTG
jgi:DNA-binding MarR family transcriptional regulator